MEGEFSSTISEQMIRSESGVNFDLERRIRVLEEEIRCLSDSKRR